MKLKIALLLALFPMRGASMLAQHDSDAQFKRVDAAFGYTAIRANAQPGGCGCFWMNGGSAQLAASDPLGFGLVFDFGMTTANGFGAVGGDRLTLATYLAGPRYTLWSRSRFTPYAQALVGAAHSSTNYLLDNRSTTVAFSTGGGVDCALNDRVSLRLAQAEFLLTQVPNGSNDRENQLRLTSGIVFHLK